MAQEVINGAFAPEKTDDERHAIGSRFVMTVRPNGRTACCMDVGKKIALGPGGKTGEVRLYKAELNGVRAYVQEAEDAPVRIILTTDVIKP